MSSSRGKIRKASAKGLQHVTPVDHPNKSSSDSKQVSAVCKDLQRLQVSQEKSSSSHLNPSASQQIDSDQTEIIKDEGVTSCLSDSKKISTDDHHPVDSTNKRSGKKKETRKERESALEVPRSSTTDGDQNKTNVVETFCGRKSDDDGTTQSVNQLTNDSESVDFDEDLESKLRGSSLRKGNRQPSSDVLGTASRERAGELEETNPLPSQTEGESALEVLLGGAREHRASRSSTTDGDQNKTNVTDILRGRKSDDDGTTQSVSRMKYDSETVDFDDDLESKLRGSSSRKCNRQPSSDVLGTASRERAGELEETNPHPSQTEGESASEVLLGGAREHRASRSSTIDGDQNKSNVTEILRGR